MDARVAFIQPAVSLLQNYSCNNADVTRTVQITLLDSDPPTIEPLSNVMISAIELAITGQDQLPSNWYIYAQIMSI